MLGYIIAFVVAMLIIGKVYKSTTGHLPEWKYFKPYSSAWWFSAIPGALGILISGEPLHGWAEMAAAAAAMTGGVDPNTLIMASAAGIGITGRLPGDKK